jgi:hypothetical protein
MSRALSWLLLTAILAGCATEVPETALRLPESTLEVRSIQTRTLTAPSEIDILTATIAVLQDMEFNIDRIEKPLGVITGCDAMSTAQDDQHITLTMVVLPSLARDGEYTARITIQRVIYDKMDRVLVLERIDDADTYQQIFDNLRKSLFIQVGEK